MSQRSRVVTVVGWIFIALAGFGLLNCLMFLFMPVDQLMAQLPKPPDDAKLDPDLFASVMRGVFLFIFGVLAWVMLSAIGLIMRKPWARISMIVLAGIGIVWNALYVLVGVTGGSAGMGAMLQGMGSAIAVMGLVFIGLFAWVIHLLRSEKVRQEFVAKSGTTPNP
jgi:hypothetical protein